MCDIDATTAQLKVVKALADGVASRDLKNVAPILSKDFIAKIFPSVAGLPSELTKEEYLQKDSAAITLFAKVEVVFHEVIEAPGKAVAHLTFLFTTADGTTIDYDSVFILSFVDEDGELKVIGAKIFSDPEKRTRFYADAAKLLAGGTPVA